MRPNPQSRARLSVLLNVDLAKFSLCRFREVFFGFGEWQTPWNRMCKIANKQKTTIATEANVLTNRQPTQHVISHVPDTTEHFRYIDSMRGIAVAGVLAVHISTMLNMPGMLGKMLGLGANGVQLFYIVSAMTLMMSMAKRSPLERNPTLNFFIRRVFRIAPAFYFTITTVRLKLEQNQLVGVS